MTTTYWRSPEERGERSDVDEPRHPVLAAGEAGPGGSSRRGFLKLVGFSLTAAGCARSPVREAVPFVDLPEEMRPGTPLFYATTCGGCSAGCGLLVKTRDGRPIKIEGNPESPLSGGGTCATGQATVLSLYDEGRLKGPLWQGQGVAWEELDETIRQRLETVASTRVGANDRRIVLLTGTVTSPTAHRLIRAWCEHHDARHVAYDPVSCAALRSACEQSFGRAVIPRYRLDRARAVVALEADFLGTWLSPVEFTCGYVSRRRLEPGRDPSLSWHAQFESRMSVTGSNADLRVPVNASEVGTVAVALYDLLKRRASAGGPAIEPPRCPVAPEILEQTADALWNEGSASLVVCGVEDPAVQTVVCAINALLGSVGETVDLESPSHQSLGDERELGELLAAMQDGEVGALVTWGVNPVYDTPFGETFAAALEKVDLKVSLSDRLDETAVLADAVCPDHHPLESWGDAEAIGGHLSLAQPTVAPLFDTRAGVVSLLRWMGRPEDAYTYLRESWRRHVFPHAGAEGDFESFWNRALHDGVLELPVDGQDEEMAEAATFRGDLVAAVRSIAGGASAATAARLAGGLDLRFYEKVSIRDGRHANNPWLQELPDPVSRVAWGNYAAVAPALAERLGLEEGDVVCLEADGREVELPVQVQPGQAPDTVAVALGYGRPRAGKAAAGIGADVYPLVPVEDGLFRGFATGVKLSATGRREELAATQTHHTLEGRPILKETTLEEYRGDAAAGNHDRHHDALPTLWPERPNPQSSWGMTIDSNACVGCSACVVACQAENNVAVVGKEEVTRGREMHWIRIDRYYRGSLESPDVGFQLMMCQHCANAPCETVCPVLATVHSSDGLNQQVYNRCIGTRYCANNCPYKVRRFNWFNYARNEAFDYHMNDDLGTLVLNPDVVVRSRGVMEKCSMCIQRIQDGKRQARVEDRELHDGDVVTACQQACPAGAIHFGDLNDSHSRVAETRHDERFYHVLEELGVRPHVGYLTRVRNRSAPPGAHSEHPSSDERRTS